MLRPIIHMILHFAAPTVLARIAYPNNPSRVWLIMVATMLVDLLSRGNTLLHDFAHYIRHCEMANG
jgi:hypothetical protein